MTCQTDVEQSEQAERHGEAVAAMRDAILDTSHDTGVVRHEMVSVLLGLAIEMAREGIADGDEVPDWENLNVSTGILTHAVVENVFSIFERDETEANEKDERLS